MSDKQRTCKERVREHLQGRLEDLRKLWDAQCKGQEDVPDLGNLSEYGLSFDYVAPGTFNFQRQGYFRYQLSWGGPSDEFRFYTGPELQPHRVEYWFMDWFDGAHVKLSGEREKLLLSIFQDFADCGTVDAQYKEAVS